MVAYSLMFWKQSTVQETEITLQWPTESTSLVVVTVIWECTRMALGCAWSITSTYCVKQLFQGLNFKCFKLFLPSLRQMLLSTLHGCVLSFCARLRDGQRGFQKGKMLHWNPLACDTAGISSLVLSWRLLSQSTTSAEPCSSAEIFISCHQWLSMSYCTQKTKGGGNNYPWIWQFRTCDV